MLQLRCVAVKEGGQWRKRTVQGWGQNAAFPAVYVAIEARRNRAAIAPGDAATKNRDAARTIALALPLAGIPVDRKNCEAAVVSAAAAAGVRGSHVVPQE